MKIIFLTNIPFIRQHRIDMYIDVIEKVYDVELWDLSVIYGQTEKVKELEKNCLKISSITEFEEKLIAKNASSNIVVITNILLQNLRRIYDCIHRLGIPIVNINKETFASWMSFAGSVSLFGNIRFLSYMKALCYYVPFTRRLFHLYRNRNVKYDYMLSSYNFYPEESRNFVRIHHVKYDEAIAAVNQKPCVGGNYILFIDASLADHPMYINHPRKVNRENYLKQLDRYFSMLEEKYKMKVVVSAHPKSMYTKDDFKGREIIMYKTPNLVFHAKYIVSHYSTSLFDVILQNKPFKVLYSYDLLHTACRGATAMGLQMATMLNVEKVDLDKPVVNDFVVDSKVYNNFKNRYIINQEKASYTNEELILQFLKSLDKDY